MPRLVIPDPESVQMHRQIFVIHWYGNTETALRIRFMDIISRDFQAGVVFSSTHIMAVRLYEYQMGYLTGLFGSLIALVRAETNQSMDHLLRANGYNDFVSASDGSMAGSSIDAEFNERFECALMLLENRLRPGRWPSTMIQPEDYSDHQHQGQGDPESRGYSSVFSYSWRPPTPPPLPISEEAEAEGNNQLQDIRDFINALDDECLDPNGCQEALQIIPTTDRDGGLNISSLAPYRSSLPFR